MVDLFVSLDNKGQVNEFTINPFICYPYYHMTCNTGYSSGGCRFQSVLK